MKEQKIVTNEQLEKRLRKAVWDVQEEFKIIEPGDKVMVCLSGGKDSYTMLEMILHMQKVMNNSFEVIAVNLDQKQPGYPEDILPEYLKNMRCSVSYSGARYLFHCKRKNSGR